MHAIKHTYTQTPLKVSPLGCLNKWAMVCMLGTLEKQNKTKDHSPSMMLSLLPIQNDLVPRKIAKRYLAQLLSWSI